MLSSIVFTAAWTVPLPLLSYRSYSATSATQLRANTVLQLDEKPPEFIPAVADGRKISDEEKTGGIPNYCIRTSGTVSRVKDGALFEADRQVTIATTDMIDMIQDQGGSAEKVDCIGEDLLVAGLTFDDFKAEDSFEISGDDGSVVKLEIVEARAASAIDLGQIGDDESKRQSVAMIIGIQTGFAGWTARVVAGGRVATDATIAKLAGPAEEGSTDGSAASRAGTPKMSAVSMMADGGADAPLESERWTAMQAELNEVPVFAVAVVEKDQKEKPLQYMVGGKQVTIFYADVDAAKASLAEAQKQNPDLDNGPGADGLDIIPVGLGTAYRLMDLGEALIVPGLAELVAAGAPADANPLGQEVPLFACMQMALTKEGELTLGEEVEEEDFAGVPLFMCHADCAAAISAPREINAVLSLANVVEERLTGDPDGESFPFQMVAPSATVKHTESYVGKGVYWRPVDEKAGLAPLSGPPKL